MKIPQPWRRGQNGSWYVTLGGVQHNLGKDEEAAKKKYAELLSRCDKPAGPEENVRKLLNLYYAWCRRNLAETTCAGHKRHLLSFGKFIAADLTAAKLRPLHVQKWLDKEHPESGPTYTNTLITVVKGAIAWAKMLGYIESDPLVDMKKPRCKVRQEFVAAADWPRVLDAAKQPRAKDFLTVMLSSGARTQEMFDMEKRHVESDRVIFPIDESKGRKRSRTIYLPDDAIPIVTRLCSEFPEGPIFRNKLGNPWNKDSVNCLFRRLKKKLKMEKFCATTLRHSFAHHRLTSGQDSLVVAKLMGHVDGRMLALRYGHLEKNSDFLKAEANRIQAAPQEPAQQELDKVDGSPDSNSVDQGDSDTDQRRTA